MICILPILGQSNKKSQTKPVESIFPLILRGGEIQVQIRNETAEKDWNQYAFEKTKGLIDAYESYTGVNFHQAAAPIYKSLPESEKNKIKLVLKDAVFLNGTRIGGYNNVSGDLGKDLGIFMEPGIVPKGYPALLLHELGHFYFTEPSWLSEGIVSFLPYLLAKKGLLKLDSEELSAVTDEWSLEEARPSKDLPLSQDFRALDPSLGLWFYSKAVRTQMILYKELGNSGYKSFLKQITLSETLNTEGVLKILNKIQKKNWNQILQGWVLPGAYGAYPANSFLQMKEIDKL
ncbi:hypothetical protein EHQ53_06500 [Leptospira langatensis]|uniref:Peptidase MA family protein n=2 Tax=Leptospira langatensis TaxID=2484983 RepID=A0A5F1ZXQ7_9LEPT|nr:hypothetical protein [Leptospira langatensis]TGK03247.1 hypothetical protein EHO57_07335 [Leptospira langatensis]TGL42421.1 hypothetical protein EHQ53_06500 [Leptospira langatensis]